MVGVDRGQFFRYPTNGHRKIILLDSGRPQPLHRIPALGDGLRCLIDGGFKSFAGVGRMLWKLVNCSLKAWQHPLKTLQERVVQVTRDACALTDARVQRHLELLLQLPTRRW